MSIDWGTQVISILQADTFMTEDATNEYTLDMNGLRLALKDQEDNVEGIPFLDTHSHNTEVTLSGVTYARTVEIINGYTCSFEVTASDYEVSCTGANHNLADVLNGNNVNLIVNNAAGLINAAGGTSSHALQLKVGSLILPLSE